MHVPQGRLSIGKVEPVKISMESLLDFSGRARIPPWPSRFRVINRLFGELGRLRIALEHFELLLDRRRKTCSCIYEHVHVSLASADVIRPKKAIARNRRPSYQTQSSDSEVRDLPAGDPMVDPLLWNSKKFCKRGLFSMFGLFGLTQADRRSFRRPTSKGALSTWNSPFRQSYRRSSQPVLNQLCDFGS